jgi:transcriptional regulator with XRE-family HTH domain
MGGPQMEYNKMHDGNLFFRHKYPSIDVERMLDRFDSFEEFDAFFSTDLMDENLLMGEYLGHLLERYGMSANKAAIEIGKTHSYVRKIVNGNEVNPSRDVLLAICVRLGTTIEEAQILLRYSGKQPLYARRKRDAIIWYALKKHQSLHDLNLYLDNHGYTPLSKLIVRNEKPEAPKL